MFGYDLNDLLSYDKCLELCELIAKHLKETGNDINVRCSRYFIRDFDVELL